MGIPDSLREKIRSGDIVPFIGSGVSLAVKDGLFPTWDELLEAMASKLDQESLNDHASIVRLKVKTKQRFQAAEEAWKALGKSRFNAVMRQTFGIPKPDDVNLELVNAIWKLSPSLVITTNYDAVLQWSNPSSRRILNRQANELVGLLSSTFPEVPNVWHLHGYVDEADTLILAPQQYARFYEDESDRLAVYNAARTQLKAVIANRSLLFIGFGANDAYVMEMLRSVIADFQKSLPPSYALFKGGPGSQDAALWDEYGIHVIEFSDYGIPLVRLVQDLGSDAPLKVSAVAAAGLSTGLSSPTHRFPGCTVTTAKEIAPQLPDLVNVLESRFSFRWEPGSYRHAAVPTVYWPVRLREPGAIHAVQSFAASALQKRGARIVLCLDDYGDKKYTVSLFNATIDRWFAKTGGDISQLQRWMFSEVIPHNDTAGAWDHIQKWLGKQGHTLERVLEICKLYKVGMRKEDFLKRGTGRLLTPGLVWACLRYLQTEFHDSPVITLGGYDERNLWQAWRECVDLGHSKVAHLYIPELANVHMDTTNLAWRSKEDVQQTLEQRVGKNKEGEWRSESEIIRWCLNGCVLLPEYCASSEGAISIPEIGADADPAKIMRPLVDSIVQWLF